MLFFAFLCSAVAQRVAAESVDATCLLQTDFGLKRQQALTDATSRKWFAWDDRLPELTDEKKMTGTSDDFVRVWTHLDDKWWTEFIDGQFHKDGPHALDHSVSNMKAGMDGEFYQHSKEVYDIFSDPSRWEKPFTTAGLAQVNAIHQGHACENATCYEMLTYVKPQSIQTVLTDYYNNIALLDGLDRRTRLQRGLPHLTTLFGTISRMHPFKDANSRTRLLMLQVEFVRLGGHPVILWGLRDNVYSDCSLTQCDYGKVQNTLLDSWCAWEFAASSGKSPFESGEYYECYDPKTQSCLENPRHKPPPSDDGERHEEVTGHVDRSNRPVDQY